MKENPLLQEKKYCCPDCGSDEIEFEAFVDEHHNFIKFGFWNGDQIWCNNCCESIEDVVYKSDFKKEVA